MTRTFDRRIPVAPYNAMLGTATLPDVEPGPDGTDRVRLTVSLRDDPLGRLHARRQIREDQYQAGRHWQALYEAAEVGAVRSVDTTVTPVDGGAWPEPLTERRRKAALELARIDRLLGQDGTSLVHAVLVHKRLFRDLAVGERMVRYIGLRFAECLTTIACATGYSTGRGA